MWQAEAHFLERRCGNHTDEKSDADLEAMSRLVSCICQMANMSSPTAIEEFLALPEALKHVVLTVEYLPAEQLCALFEFMSAITIQSENAWVDVYDALRFLQETSADSWDLLVEIMSDSLDLKTAYAMSVNTLLVSCTDPKKKVCSLVSSVEKFPCGEACLES